MTTQPGNAALGLWSNHRTKRPCHLVKVVRTDGYALRFTDYDRALTFEDEVYVPAQFSGVSAERREVGASTPTQQMHGIIDGTTVAIPDMWGQRYRGAEVWHVITDWRWPWLAIARHYKRIRSVAWDGQRFIATLAGVTQDLERPSGGRFDGVLSPECVYRLGDAATCKKDISADVYDGVRVSVVTDETLQCTLDGLPNTYTDNYYRYGEMEWTFDAPDHTGTADILATTLTEAPSPGWTVNEHVGRYLLVLAAAGGRMQASAVLISANTADTLTYATLGAAYMATPYAIADAHPYAGVVSEIEWSDGGTPEVRLFIDTPFTVTVGMRATVRPGCDGLFTTCVAKFANGLNHPGGHLQPNPADQLEVAQ